jgi:ERCC4-type nuclease
MKIYFFLCIFLFTLLTACTQSTSTGYVKRDVYWGNRYGCNEKRISDNEFAIIAEGNIHSSVDHVAKLALYHAAHVTIENNKKFFQIVKQTDNNLASYQLITINILGVFVPVGETENNEVTSILIIRITDKEQDNSSNNINALQVIKELEPVFKEKQNT